MSNAFDLLGLPLLACLLLIGIHCQFGLQVLKRNVVFVDLALAQCAALGATVAFMQGHLPQSTGAYAWSLGFAWGAALLLSLIRYAPARIPAEALVGVLYVASAAAALLLIEKAPQGAEHLKQILTGSVLTVSLEDLTQVAPLYALIGALLGLAVRRGWLAHSGVAGWLADLVFYAAFGLVVTSSVALAGVLLVFSFLIIPALIGLLWANSSTRQLLLGWAVGGFAAGLGLLASYVLDTSTGGTLVCAFALALGLALAVRALRDAEQGWRKAIRLGGKGAVAVLLGSTVWLAAQPRADQPLLDAVEAWWPTLRAAYFSPQDQTIYADAEHYVKRYSAEMERLGQLEVRSRWQGTALDDETLRKMSSFQQSYNEMIKGERFVMREIRSRAREQLRWPLLVMLGAGLVGVWVWRLSRRRQTPSLHTPRARSA